MRTSYYIAYRNAEDKSVDEVGCVGELDRKFFHDLLDEFLDKHRLPGNTTDPDQTCFRLQLCCVHQ